MTTAPTEKLAQCKVRIAHHALSSFDCYNNREVRCAMRTLHTWDDFFDQPPIFGDDFLTIRDDDTDQEREYF